MDIVVGVDGSAASVAALRWAVGEAASRGVSVQAWHAWHVTYSGSGVPPDDLAAEAGARKALDRAVEAVDARGVAVERVLVRAVAASALIDAGRRASLVVVGRGGGAVGGVAAQVLAHAPCPVVVVPG